MFDVSEMFIQVFEAEQAEGRLEVWIHEDLIY